MKTNFNITEAQKNAWLDEIQLIRDNLSNAVIPLNRSFFFTESEVREMIGVTPRTLLNYRKKKYIGYIKLDGRILYIKSLLYADLLTLYLNSKS